MPIFSATAPRPLLNTRSSERVNYIRIQALSETSLEYEPPRVVRWFRLPPSVRLLRHRLYVYMEEPLSSKKALLVNVFLGICNVLSTFTYCLETLPYYRKEEVSRAVWYWWEVLLMTIFTIELILRAPAQTTVRQFVFSRPEIVIDCIACIPFDIYLFGGLHLAILDTRWIRPIRLLRLVKLGNNILDLKLILEGVRRSVWMIVLVWCLVLLMLFSFASMLFIGERGPWDASRKCYLDPLLQGCSKFDSVPSSLYFAMEVTSSLGYGDVVPLTSIGRGITMVLMIMSVSILALTVTVFSIHFSQVYHKVRREMTIDSLREATDLRMREVCFDENVKSVTTNKFLNASCRLVTAVEILQAISLDLSEAMKVIRSELVFLSETGTPGAINYNKRLGACKQSMAGVVEKILAELAASAYNDLDTLTSFTLRSTEDLFVDGHAEGW